LLKNMNINQTIARRHPGLFSTLGASLFFLIGAVASEGIAATVVVSVAATSPLGTRSDIQTATDLPGEYPLVFAAQNSPYQETNNSSAQASGAAGFASFVLFGRSDGVASSNATYENTYSFSNLSDEVRQYTLNGVITAGSIFFNDRSYTGGGNGFADFRWELAFNGNSIELVKGSTSVVSGGIYSGVAGSLQNLTDLSITSTGISWSDTAYSSVLGNLNPGESGEILVNAYVRTDTQFEPSEFFYYADYASGLRVQFGDPSGGNSFDVTSAVVLAVPEPSEWLMMAAGLAVVGVMSRRARARPIGRGKPNRKE
jgi:hypothetical protein